MGLTDYPIQDVVAVIAKTLALAEQHKRQICLRGFETVECYAWSPQLAAQLAGTPPAVVLLDLDELEETAMGLVSALARQCALLCLAPRFDEEQFITAYDAGMRDYLIKPVEQTYLVSRILQAMDTIQMQKTLAEHKTILQSLSVLSPTSGVYTSDYFLRLFHEKLTASNHYWKNPETTALLVVQVKSADPACGLDEAAVGTILQRCARTSDILGEFGRQTYIAWLTNAGLDGARALSARIAKTLAQHPERAVSTGQVVSGLSDLQGCEDAEAFITRALDDLRQKTGV